MPYKDPEKAKAYRKTYYVANREEVRAKHKAYKEANREELNAANKVYREANREKILTVNKAWRAANREKVNAYSKAYSTDPLNSASHSIYQLTGLKRAEIPTELLEAQALIISIHREIKNHEKLHRA
jgi:hypothetical protein